MALAADRPIWFLFLVILKNWWDLASGQYSVDWMNIYYFLAYGHMLVPIYLSARVALPDGRGDRDIDLREFYFANHRYFWLLIGLTVVTAAAIGSVKQAQFSGGFDAVNSIGSSVFLMITVLLAASQRYWVHAVFVSLLLLAVGVEILGKVQSP